MKKRRDTAKDRFLKETKDYEEAQNLNLWKTERKFADELLQGIRNLELPLKLDKLTKYGPESFYVAILQQMKRKSIYESLTKEHQELANQMLPRLLRKQICESMLTSENSEVEEDHPNPGINTLKCEFIKERMSEKWGSWNAYWKRMGDEFSSFFPNDWQFQATALFLKLDLKVVKILTTGGEIVDHYLKTNTFITTYLFESQCKKLDITKTLLIGLKTNIHFQSLLENFLDKKSNGKDKDTEAQDVEVKNECSNCHKKFQNLLKHISRSPCKSKIDDSIISELKERAKMKHKAKNNFYKASSRKNLEMHETYAKREERLNKKRKIAKQIRESRLKEDSSKLRKTENDKKRLSRKKQRKENPYYENPRFKEKDIYEDILEEDVYSKRRWKYRKYEELQEKLFGKEDLEDWKKRYDKEQEIYGEESWEQKMERYEKTDLDRRIKKQQEKEKEFRERNRATFNSKLSVFDNPDD